MFSSQQIMCCLLAGLISGFPLLLSSQEKVKEPEKTEEKKVVPPIKIKKSSDKDEPGPIEEFKPEEPIDIKKGLETLPEEIPDTPVPLEPEEDRKFRKDTVQQISEIIKKAQSEYPSLSKTLSDDKRIEILKSAVDTLGRGMEYVTADEFKTRKVKDNSDIDPVSAIMIASNRVLYIRLDSLSKKSLKQLKADCESNANLAQKPLGIILDLRSAQNFDYQSAVKALGIFASPNELLQFNLMTGYKQILKSPVILLTGGDTCGAPEIFAKLLIEMKRGISLGGQTAGVPFKKREIKLSNGDYLMIPQIPDMLGDIAPEAVKPSIKFAPYPQLTYKQIREVAGAEKDDKCIQRAVELIICLDALGN